VLNGTTTPIPVNAATNRLSNAYYDANGNMTSGAGASITYDEANRLSGVVPAPGGVGYYGYDPSNKRVYERDVNGGETYIFYGAQGEKLGTYTLQGPWMAGCYYDPSNPVCTGSGAFVAQTTGVWFAGKLIMDTSVTGVLQDRLGTNRAAGARFYPYGEEITSPATANDRVKFGTYTRDAVSGFDYAAQRFYASSYGRFNSPDPSKRSSKLKSPQSLNKYAYSRNDPVNRNDPRGLCDVVVGGVTNNSSNSDALTTFASSIGANLAFPDANGGFLTGLWDVASQSLASGQTAANAIVDSIQKTPAAFMTNIFTYSGGAQAVATGLQIIGSNPSTAPLLGRIGNITYMSPGSGQLSPLPTGMRTTSALIGSQLNPLEALVTSTATLPIGTNIYPTDAGHSQDQQISAMPNLLNSLSGPACPQTSTFEDPGDGDQTQVWSTVSYPGASGGGGGGSEDEADVDDAVDE
jgi:RHS repeat-associated protein